MGRSAGGSRSTIDTTSIATSIAAAVDNFVTAAAQCFFGEFANVFVAISESTGQSSHNFGATAAAVFANLTTDLISGFSSDTLIGIVQSIDESTHDFGAADAVAFAKLLDRFAAIFRVAAGLRLIDQLGDFARIIIAARLFAALGRSTAIGSTRRSAISSSRTASSSSGSTSSRCVASGSTSARTRSTSAGTRSTGTGSCTGFGSRSTAGFRCTAIIAARRLNVRALALIHIHLGFTGPGNGWLTT